MNNTDNKLDALEERFSKLVVSDDEAFRIERERIREEESKRIAYEAEHGSPPVRKLMKTGFGRRESECALSNPQGQEWLLKRNRVMEIIRCGGTAIVSGDCGTGKTVMAASIGNDLIVSGKSVVYVRAVDFFRGLKDSWRKDSSRSEDEYLLRFENAGLLVLDEIQDRSAGDWENSIINNVVDHRYSNVRATLILTNKIGMEALEAIPRSIVSRATETGAFITCDWKSYREKQ